MYEHNALGYRSSLALFLTKVRSSRALCPDTGLICTSFLFRYSEHVEGSPIINTFNVHNVSTVPGSYKYLGATTS